MADTLTTNGASGWWQRLSRVLLVTAVVIIVLFNFWLAADQEISAAESGHDDLWFVRKGKCAYWFDEGYSQMSFIKEPIYPLFIWVSYQMGFPLRLAHEVVYLAAAGFLAWALVLRQSRPYIGLVVFAVCALHPIHYYGFQRSLNLSLYPSLLMLTLGALLLQFKLRDEPGRWWRRLLSGLTLGLLWSTRAERPLIVLFLLPFLTADAFREWHRKLTFRAAFRAWVAEWLPPLAVLAGITLAIMSANYTRWGTFSITDMEAPGFNAAYRALLSLRPEHPMPHIPLTREVRERAYAISPSFREVAPFFEGELGNNWSSCGKTFYDIPPGEISAGWDLWCLRDAAAQAGHYRSASDSESFYYRVANEINTGAKGRLTTRAVPPFSVDPCLDDYLPSLIPGWRLVWWMCWASREDVVLGDDEACSAESLQTFNSVACRRSIPRDQPTTQSRIRTWIGFGYGPAMEIALIAGCLIAAAIPLICRTRSGSGFYLLSGLVFGIAGFSRLALFMLIDASSFPASEPLYIFPAALMLSVMAIWLLAEGLRLLGSRLLKTSSQVPSEAVRTPSYRRTRIVLSSLMFLTFVLLLFQKVEAVCEPPDVHLEHGSLEGIDGNAITGWARLKNQPERVVTVELYEGETLLTTALADQFRPGLRDIGVKGDHGFSCPTPTSLKDWRPHQIQAKIAGTNIELLGSPKTIILAGGKTREQLATDHPTLGGSLDQVGDEMIAGWAWDASHPSSSVNVDIYEGDSVLTLLATVPADQFNQCLLDAKIGNGSHAFTYTLPARLRDGKPHTIRVTISGTEFELGQCPKVITPKPPQR